MADLENQFNLGGKKSSLEDAIHSDLEKSFKKRSEAMGDIKWHSHTVPHGLRKSPTLTVADAAKTAEADGRKVFSLGAGQLENTPTDEQVASWKEQLIADEKENPSDPLYEYANTPRKYPPKGKGTVGLRAAAAKVFMRDSDMNEGTMGVTDGKPEDQVAAAGGAKGALNGLFSELKPGDVAFVASTGWPTNYDMFPPGVEIIELDSDGTGLVPPETYKKALEAFPEVKTFLINSPNNPTGEKYSVEDREEIMKLTSAHRRANPKDDLFVTSDNPYGRFVYDGSDQKMGKEEKALYKEKGLVTVWTMSKNYGLPGDHLGYVVSARESAISNVAKWGGSKGGVPSTEAMNLAQAALLYGEDFVESSLKDLEPKRQALIDAAKEIKGVKMTDPAATIYGMLDFSEWLGKTIPAQKGVATLDGKQYALDAYGKEGDFPGMLDGKEFQMKTPDDIYKAIVQVAGVNGVFGPPFSAPGSPFGEASCKMRVCFSGKQANLEAAMTRIKTLSEKLIEKDKTTHLHSLTNGGSRGSGWGQSA
jgi:aspartate/methionine/tyrosine aminotransferase